MKNQKYVIQDELTLEDLENHKEVRVLFENSNDWFQFVNMRVMFPWDRNGVSQSAEVVKVLEGKAGKTLKILVKAHNADTVHPKGPPSIYGINSQDLKISKVGVLEK